MSSGALKGKVSSSKLAPANLRVTRASVAEVFKFAKTTTQCVACNQIGVQILDSSRLLFCLAAHFVCGHE